MKPSKDPSSKRWSLPTAGLVGVFLIAAILIGSIAAEDLVPHTPPEADGPNIIGQQQQPLQTPNKEEPLSPKASVHHEDGAEIHNEGRTREIRSHQRHRERIRHDHISRLLHQEHREAVKQNVDSHEEIDQRMRNRYKSFVDSRVPGRDDESHLEHGFDYEEYDDVREHMRDKHSRYNPYLGYYMFEAKYKWVGSEATFEDCFDRANQWSHRLEALTDVPCEVIPRNRETLLVTVRDVTHGPYVESLVKKFEDCLSIEFKTRFDPPHLV